MNRSAFIVAAIVVVLGVGAFAFVMRGASPPEPPRPMLAARATPAPTSPGELAPGEEIIITIDRDKLMSEMRYLPDEVKVVGGAESRMLENVDLPSGTRRVVDTQPLTNREEHGEFLLPRFSPDGLSILMSGPGHQGLYVMSVLGGDPIPVSDANGFAARWTPDGRIMIPDDEGYIRVYGPDGILEEVRADDRPVISRDDIIFRRTSPSDPGVPMTGDDDRYFNPVLSPDGSKVVYQGLYTGLYMANADGTGKPQYLGPGYNPSWLPDSTGFVFDMTLDDGHDVLEGHLYFVDREGTERTNMTPASELIAQMPTVGADGTIVFEVDGQIYTGKVQP